jgi:hypothetical protein
LTKKTPYKGLGADSEEKREPVSDIDIAAADSLKVLDLKGPIREATEILGMGREVAIPRCIRILFKTTANLHNRPRTVLLAPLLCVGKPVSPFISLGLFEADGLVEACSVA